LQPIEHKAKHRARQQRDHLVLEELRQCRHPRQDAQNQHAGDHYEPRHGACY